MTRVSLVGFVVFEKLEVLKKIFMVSVLNPNLFINEIDLFLSTYH